MTGRHSGTDMEWMGKDALLGDHVKMDRIREIAKSPLYKMVCAYNLSAAQQYLTNGVYTWIV